MYFKILPIVSVGISSFLLFLIQPFAAKKLLPLFGSSPTVWLTCLFFFQGALLVGYIYSHFLTKCQPRVQVYVHLILLVVAFFTLPAFSGLKIETPLSPVPSKILYLLAKHIGLPFILLSSSTPLIQFWLGQSFPSFQVYRIYSISNAGSLIALFSYPSLLEPFIYLNMQGFLWAGFFLFYLFTLLPLTWQFSRISYAKVQVSGQDSSIKLIGKWLVLAAWASINLSLVTNHLTQDISPVPFVWVVPLAIYLITFIIAFAREKHDSNYFIAFLLMVSILFLCFANDDEIFRASSFWGVFSLKNMGFSLALEMLIYGMVLFGICTLCHQKLAQLKPEASSATFYYCMIAFGSLLGTFSIVFICPYIFDSFYENNIAIFVNFLVAAFLLIRRVWSKIFWIKLISLILFIGMVFYVFYIYLYFQWDQSFHYRRNFFGVIHTHFVSDPLPYQTFYHGRIVHGIQVQTPELERVPQTYFTLESGIGKSLHSLSKAKPLRVAILGLGIGTLATYSKEGDFFHFLEINPQVKEICDTRFTYLKQAKGDVQVSVGDGRLLLSQEKNKNNYDVIILDAFSGDAIPIHLLTLDAFREYYQVLEKEGTIAVQISNRHIDLMPVLVATAETFSKRVFYFSHSANDEFAYSSRWVILTNDPILCEDPSLRSNEVNIDNALEKRVFWWDEKNSLLQVLKP